MNSVTDKSLSAKDEVLRRIGEALPGDPHDPDASYRQIKRQYMRFGTLTHEQSLELLINRLLDYDTEIIQLDADAENGAGIAEAISRALQHLEESSLLTPEMFPPGWLPTNVRIVRDRNLTTAQLNQEITVVTTCEAAVASTGTIFLVHAGTQGRRVLTLLPDHHICLLRRDQVYETVAEAVEFVAPRTREPMTTISGPSATSDIEMTRIRGVHGPRRLTVILYGRARDQS